MGNPFRKLRQYYGETVIELKKATWPNRTELRHMTVMVIIAVIILGAFISVSDFALYNVVDLCTTLVRHGFAL